MSELEESSLSVSEAARVLSNSRHHKDEEEAYGKAGVEQSQGYREMALANPLPKDDLGPLDSAEVSEELRQDREQPAPIDRQYAEIGGEHHGRPRPPEETISARQAAYDLSLARDGESDAIAAAEAVQLQSAIDSVRSEVQQPQQEIPAVQEQEHSTIPPPNAQEGDDVIQALERNPKLLGALQDHMAQINSQAERTRQAHEQQLARAYQAEATSGLAAFSEFNGMSVPQAQGALHLMRTQNPQRFAVWAA